MAELTVDAVYGIALFDVASELDKVDQVHEELDFIVAILAQDPDFSEFLRTPTIPKSEKKLVLKNCFEDQISPELMNFLFILADKKRCPNIKGIAAFYKKKMDNSRNIAEGTIFSVEPLTIEEIGSFEMETGKLLKRTVKLNNETDTAILGGVKIFIEGKVIDATIQRQLRDLKENLSQMAV